MQPLRRLSVAEQAAAHMRTQLRQGHWGNKLPGVATLAAALDVSVTNMQAALKQLEAEGLLETQGPRRSRIISRHTATQRKLRVGILLHDSPRDNMNQPDPIMHQLQHALAEAGHEVFLSLRSQVELKHHVQNIVHHIHETPADAWIVAAGSRPVLEWFAAQPVPCMALYGRTENLPIARTGPDKAPAYIVATKKLITLGHRRIVLIALRSRRTPTPGNVEQAFLDELAAHQIATGDYNLPDWQETPEGFSKLLENIFSHTPPTALIVDEISRMIATLQFLARHRILVPDHVSLVSPEYDNSLTWCHPVIAHMRWSYTPIVRRIVRWVNAVKRGCADHKTINYPVEFIPGGTIGPAPHSTYKR